MSFSSVYPHYVAKAQKKGRTQQEVDQIIHWLTGHGADALARHLTDKTSFADFFAEANVNPNAGKITGVICGYRVEEIQEEPMRQIRYLDKMIDELAKGKTMAKILRQ